MTQQLVGTRLKATLQPVPAKPIVKSSYKRFTETDPNRFLRQISGSRHATAYTSQAIHAQAAKQGSAASQTPAAAQPGDSSMDQDAAGDSSSASDSDSSESDYDDVETPSANPKPQYKVHQQQEPDASLAREQHDLSTTRSHDSVADTSAAIDPVSTAEEATVVTQQPQLLVAMGLSSDELQHVTQKVWEVFGDTL